MKPLQTHITKGDRTFTQLKKSDKAYLYEVRTDSGAVYYEVFRHKENTQFNVISYPGDNSFGSWAWNIPNKDKATTIFSLLSSGMPGNDINRFLCGEKVTLKSGSEQTV